MPILTDIENAMKAAILNISIANGYNYKWNTVNQEDLALCTYPCAEIYATEERNLDTETGAWFQAYENEVEFEIRVIGELKTVATSPNYSINAIHNKALDDLKQLFGTNHHISDTCDRIMYLGMTRETKTSGDVFTPGEMVTRWAVRYTQDRLEPETYAS